jgi:branched-chain amino acid transport system substrate-binding protein
MFPPVRFLAAVLALAAAACGGAPSADEILLGASLPLTGKESRAGLMYKNGYMLAVDELNAAGGVPLKSAGKRVPIRLEILDDKSDSTTAVQLAEHLVTIRGVHALLSTYETKLVLAQSIVPERHQIPYVSGGGAASEIFKRDFRWVFGVLSSVEAMAGTFGDWLTIEQDARRLPTPVRIALAWENTAHGQDFRNGLQQRVAARPERFTLVMNESFELNTKDFTPLILKLKASNADVFLSDTHYPDFVLQHRTYLQMGLWHAVVSYGPRGSEQSARETFGAGVDHLVTGQWWTPELPYAESKAFVENYVARFGEIGGYYPGLAYEAIKTIAAAIEAAGSTDREAVRDALENMNRTGAIIPGGRVYFPKETGFQIDNPSVLVQNMPDGSLRIIHPPDATTGAAVVPMPARTTTH